MMNQFYNGKRLPEYYDTMYLDGYSADEVYVAFHRSLQKKVSKIQSEKDLEQQVENKLKKTVGHSLDEILKVLK